MTDIIGSLLLQEAAHYNATKSLDEYDIVQDLSFMYLYLGILQWKGQNLTVKKSSASTVNILSASTLRAHVHTSGNPSTTPLLTHSQPHSPPLSRPPTHTAGRPACRWPRLSHTLPSCLCGTWEPLWSQASHTSMLMTLRPAAQRKCAPWNKDWVTNPPPSSHTHTHTPSNTGLPTGLPGTPSGQIVRYCHPVKHGRHSAWELERLK